MLTVPRRLRAVAVTALTWSVGWAVTGAILRLAWPYESGGPAATVWVLLASGLEWMLPGATSGAAYAILVMIVAPRRIEEMSVARMAALGAVGGGLLPVLISAAWSLSSSQYAAFGWSVLPRYALAGAVCGAISLVLARRRPTSGMQAALPSESFPSTSAAPPQGLRVKDNGGARLIAIPELR